MRTHLVLFIRHRIEGTLLSRHFVYVRTATLSTTTLERRYGARRTKDVVVGVVTFPDQPSQCLLTLRA